MLSAPSAQCRTPSSRRWPSRSAQPRPLRPLRWCRPARSEPRPQAGATAGLQRPRRPSSHPPPPAGEHSTRTRSQPHTPTHIPHTHTHNTQHTNTCRSPHPGFLTACRGLYCGAPTWQPLPHNLRAADRFLVCLENGPLTCCDCASLPPQHQHRLRLLDNGPAAAAAADRDAAAGEPGPHVVHAANVEHVAHMLHIRPESPRIRFTWDILFQVRGLKPMPTRRSHSSMELRCERPAGDSSLQPRSDSKSSTVVKVSRRCLPTQCPHRRPAGVSLSSSLSLLRSPLSSHSLLSLPPPHVMLPRLPTWVWWCASGTSSAGWKTLR